MTLSDYIKNSKLIVINDRLKVRLSEELLEDYKNGMYDVAIKSSESEIKQIESVGLAYPAKSKPVFYLYIVPDENFVELLDFPAKISTKGGGKPVECFDPDGFPRAVGISNNMIANFKQFSTSRIINNIHEWIHIVEGYIAGYKGRFFSEGFSEMFPYYLLDYENKYVEHRNFVSSLKESEIKSVEELIALENANSFDNRIYKDKSCSFDLSYASSYLFVRGIIEKTSAKYNLDKTQATQKLLDFAGQSASQDEQFVEELTVFLDIPKKNLLNEKTLQLSAQKNLSTEKILKENKKTTPQNKSKTLGDLMKRYFTMSLTLFLFSILNALTFLLLGVLTGNTAYSEIYSITYPIQFVVAIFQSFFASASNIRANKASTTTKKHSKTLPSSRQHIACQALCCFLHFSRPIRSCSQSD